MVLNVLASTTEVLARVQASARRARERSLHKLTFLAMGTDCRVHCHGASDAATDDFLREVLLWVAGFEARYSRFLPDSLVGRINAAAGEHWVDLDPETDRLLAFCNELVFFTRGAFDPTALPLIQLWNWKARPATVPGAEAIRAARELVSWRKVQRRPGGIFLPQRGMALDLGGIGKEYAVDCVINMALERGIPNVLVDFGQDVRVRGATPERNCWRIGLEDALRPGNCWAAVAVTDHAVATSGDYLRCWEWDGKRYGHIVDPRTGYPVDNGCRAVTVIAPSCTIAGVLSTTAFILGPQEGLRLIESHLGAQGSSPPTKPASTRADYMNMPMLRRLTFASVTLMLVALPLIAGWKVGDALPDLTQQSLEGQLPAELKGKVILVDFWASWCVPCAQSFPVMEKLHQTYKDQGLVVLGVNTDEKCAAMDKFLKKHPVTFAVVPDAAQKLVSQADAPTMPTSYLIGREGKVRFVHAGFHATDSPKQYTSEIETLLKEKP